MRKRAQAYLAGPYVSDQKTHVYIHYVYVHRMYHLFHLSKLTMYKWQDESYIAGAEMKYNKKLKLTFVQGPQGT